MSLVDRLPAWFQAPDQPALTRPLRVGETTSARRLVAQVAMSAPRYTVPAAAMVMLHQVGEALVPIIMGVAIDRAVATSDVRQLVLWLAVLAADFLLLSFSYRFGARIGLIGMFTIQHRLRCAVADRLLDESPAASTSPGAAITLATSDVSRVSTAVSITIFRAGELAAVLFGGVALLLLAWPIGLAVLVGAPLVIWLADRLATPLHRRSTAEQDEAGEASAQAADIMRGYRVIRGLGAEGVASARYRAASQRALGAALRARRAEGAFVAMADVAAGLFVTAVGIVAAVAALRGALSIGALIAVVGLTQFLLSPLQALALNAGTTWAVATASADRLLPVLRQRDDTAPPLRTHAANPTRGGSLVLDSLAPVDLHVGIGEIVAVDADGADAELLVAALSESAGPGVLVAPHRADLFDGTVLENVLLPGVPRQSAERALRAAACTDLATSLPQGYDTPVGERGTRLSGGQRQRVALARALAQDARLLVLHDPTTSVDTVTESLIAEGLRQVRGRHRTILVTRSATLQSVADRVIRLGHGRVPDGV